MQWRAKVNADNMNELFQNNKHKDQLLAYWPASAYWENPPVTNDGSIVIMEALGRVDPSIIDAVGQENLVQYHIWSMEQLEGRWFALMEEKGYWPGFVMFEDLGGLGWHSMSSKVLSLCQEIVHINQNYYPDMLRKMWVLNVPSIFYMSWKVIQLWLDSRTLVKIELHGGDISSIKEKVYKVCNKDSMPIRLGGNSDKDIGLGGPVGKPSMKLAHKCKYVDVARSGSYDTSIDFAEGDVVAWQFKCKYYDIGFCLSFEGKGDIVPSQRHDADKRVIDGSVTIQKTGKYTFTWDNSYSWTKSKQIKYNLRRNNDIVYP
jgi:hypothetical protein